MKKTCLIFGATLLLSAVALTGCGGGGGGGGSAQAAPTQAPAAPALNIDFAIKQLKFSWASVSGATSYKLMENPDGVSGFTQVGADIGSSQTTATQDIAVHTFDWVHAQYVVQACNAVGCTSSSVITATAGMLKTIGYFKASNPDAADGFGAPSALSADGNTLAVAAPGEGSAAAGINGNQTDNSKPAAGAVYVFSHASGSWVQQAYIKASNPDTNDLFGLSITLSADGNTLAVGAPYEASAGSGINSNTQSDNSVSKAGAVYVFSRVNTTWSQQAYIKEAQLISNEGDQFGAAVSLSADGNTLVAGAQGAFKGYIAIFTRTNTTWSQQGPNLQGSNTVDFGYFGSAVAISGDGNTVAVGELREPSSSTGINSTPSNQAGGQFGAVFVFTRASAAWSEQAYIKSAYAQNVAEFGSSVALSFDGNTLAVGAHDDHSGATGVNGNPSATANGSSGAAYVFSRTGTAWSQQAFIKPSSIRNNEFGVSVALSSDGNTLLIGADEDSSAAVGIDGNENDTSAQAAGAAYLFTRNTATWTQQRYIKAPTVHANDQFGYSVALSADSQVLAVGALGESSSSAGIGGDQTNISAISAGAVDLY